MKTAFVLDCSIALAWCFEDEETSATQALLLRMEKEAAAIPSWLFIEIANGLAISERKGRINAKKLAEFLDILENCTFEIDDEAPARAFGHLLPLCRTHKLTSYDAMYLDLALRRRLPLATLDKDLAKAAKKLGIKVLGLK